MSPTVTLVVTLLYNGIKAQAIANDYQQGITTLCEDLGHLKLTLPKRENITFVSSEFSGSPSFGYEFFWPSVKRFGPLHQGLIKNIPPKFAEEKAYHAQLLISLSICSLSFTELIVPKTEERPLKRKSSLIEGDPKPKFRNKQWIKAPDAPTPHANDSSRQRGNAHNLEEAQTLLDDVASSMRPHKIPKVELVEPSLGNSPHRGESIASSRASPLRHPGSLPPMLTTPQPIMISDGIPVTSISPPNQPALALLPTKPPQSPRPPVVENGNHQPPQKSPSPPGLSIQSRLGPPSSPSSSSGSQSHSASRTLTQDSPVPRRPQVPKPDDIPKIQKLTRELWDLRRQATAGVARETSILNQLKDLNSPPIPESSIHFKHDEYPMKSRLWAVEQELQDEKRRRMDAEEALKDVERECREPFVVPALLEAFISISKITSQAVNLGTKA